jgi:hypothetical protein
MNYVLWVTVSPCNRTSEETRSACSAACASRCQISSEAFLLGARRLWLNQVEIWFAKIEREVIARGIFTSVPDLAHKLRRCINAYSAHARPIQWKYSDPTRCVRSNEFTATGH